MEKIITGDHVLEHQTHPENWTAMELLVPNPEGTEANSFALLRIFPDLQLEQVLEMMCLTEQLRKTLGLEIAEKYRHMIEKGEKELPSPAKEPALPSSISVKE